MKKFCFQVVQIIAFLVVSICFHYHAQYWWLAVVPWVLLNIFGVFLAIPLHVFFEQQIFNDAQAYWFTEKVVFALFFIVPTILAVLSGAFAQWWRARKRVTSIRSEQSMESSLSAKAGGSPPPLAGGAITGLLNKDKAKARGHWLLNLVGIGTVVLSFYFHIMHHSFAFMGGMTMYQFSAFYALLASVSLASGVMCLCSARSSSRRVFGSVNILLGGYWIVFSRLFLSA